MEIPSLFNPAAIGSTPLGLYATSVAGLAALLTVAIRGFLFVEIPSLFNPRNHWQHPIGVIRDIRRGPCGLTNGSNTRPLLHLYVYSYGTQRIRLLLFGIDNPCMVDFAQMLFKDILDNVYLPD